MAVVNEKDVCRHNYSCGCNELQSVLCPAIRWKAKTGDKLICVDASGPALKHIHLKKSAEYTFMSIEESGCSLHVEEHAKVGWFPWRFVLKEVK